VVVRTLADVRHRSADSAKLGQLPDAVSVDMFIGNGCLGIQLV
jgi:hypothetical protein